MIACMTRRGRHGGVMMRDFRVYLFLSAAALILAAASPVHGEIVVDHQPWPTGGPASDTDLVDPLSTLTAQQAADDFLLAEDASILHLTWWGFFGSSATNPAEQPPDTQSFRIRFYDARPGDGLPGNVINEEIFIDPFFEATGRQVATGAFPDEFKFDADLASAVLLSASTPYWLEIVQLGSADSFFRWEFSIDEQNGFAFRNAATVDWRADTSPGDMAFQLLTIPEPSSAAFWLLIAVFLFNSGGGKEAS